MKYQSAIFVAKIDDSTGIDMHTAYELVAAMAGEAGFESFETEGDTLVGYVQEALFDKEALDEALSQFPIEGVSVSYTLHDVEDKDWNADWENNGFEPIDIDGRCVIHDTLHPTPAQTGAMDVVIDAKMAFGTGCHATTRMMVRALLDLDLGGKRVLDCGCGTGILGIVAAKAGAAEVVGYDIDEWSLFDVVVANINRNILLNDMAELREVMASESLLIISGFYESDAGQLIACAQGLGLSVITTSSDGDWSSLVFSTSSES